MEEPAAPFAGDKLGLWDAGSARLVLIFVLSSKLLGMQMRVRLVNLRRIERNYGSQRLVFFT
jgi:hypothetical protein